MKVKINKIWTIVIFSCVVVLLASSLFVHKFIKNRLETIRDRSDFTLISGPIKSSFSPKHDNLNVVVIAFKNPDLKSYDQFVFNVLGDKDEVLRQVEFSGQNMRDPSNIRFQFEPISDIVGKNVWIRVQPKATPGPHPVSISLTKDGQIAFSAYYRSSTGAGIIKGIVDGWIKRIKDDTLFFSIWLGILMTLFFAGRSDRKV